MIQLHKHKQNNSRSISRCFRKSVYNFEVAASNVTQRCQSLLLLLSCRSRSAENFFKLTNSPAAPITWDTQTTRSASWPAKVNNNLNIPNSWTHTSALCFHMRHQQNVSPADCRNQFLEISDVTLVSALLKVWLTNCLTWKSSKNKDLGGEGGVLRTASREDYLRLRTEQVATKLKQIHSEELHNL
jgi:hypothetical protein